jgi:hypothetical protein
MSNCISFVGDGEESKERELHSLPTAIMVDLLTR